MACGGDANTVDTPALLAHSLATAAAAEWLTGHVRRIPAPEAFIAGLLHNLGVVVQLTVDPPRVQNMIAARRGDPERGIRALELECSAVSHEECAAIVFDAWQLPDSLVAATRHHHDPMAAAEAHRELAALVHVGAHLALVCGNTFDLEPAAADLDVRATAHLGLTAADLGRAAVELPQRITELRRAVLGG